MERAAPTSKEPPEGLCGFEMNLGKWHRPEKGRQSRGPGGQRCWTSVGIVRLPRAWPLLLSLPLLIMSSKCFIISFQVQDYLQVCSGRSYIYLMGKDFWVNGEWTLPRSELGSQSLISNVCCGQMRIPSCVLRRRPQVQDGTGFFIVLAVSPGLIAPPWSWGPALKWWC